MIPIITLVIVFLLVAIRQIGRIRFKIWHIMAMGAVIVLVSRQITLRTAVESIEPEVMIFLFCIFIVGQAMEESGYLEHISSKLFSGIKSCTGLILLILFGAGLLSALLMNDTIAIIGTSAMLLLARHTGINPKILLITLAFAVTTGSVISPIGNPQNILIAVNSTVSNPFVTFSRYLMLPTLINLLVAYLFIRLFYRKQFHRPLETYPSISASDQNLTRLSRISLIILLLMVAINIILALTAASFHFSIIYIAIFAALPVVIFSPRRLEIVRKIDWATLVFFASMFILMRSVWDTGIFQTWIEPAGVDLTRNEMILGTSTLLSQLISNVPLVALYLPMLMKAGAETGGMMALAAGSTIAGNLSIMGAASNIIIIQNSEKKAGVTISFLEFSRIGIPLTIVQLIIYWAFLTIL